MTVAACGAALADGDSELVERDDGNAWHFRVGPVMAPRVRVKVSGARQVFPSSAVSGSVRYGMGGSVAADPSAGYVDREYIDGHVKLDEGTVDPGSIESGLTWNWSASDVAAQYSAGRMEFRSDMSRWSESVSSAAYGYGGSGSASDQDILLGVEAMGGWTFFDDATFDAAIDAGFRFYGSSDLKSESQYGTSVTTTRNEYRYVDSYDASGWTYVPRGSYDGTESGPGRVIGAMPTRREELMDSTSSSETYWFRSSTKLDYRIWDLRLGPTVGWKAMDWLTVRGGVYGLLGLVDAKLSSQSADGSSGGKKSSCEAVFGVAPGLSAQVNITDNIFLMGGAEYDWWTDDVNLRAGDSNAHVKLSDFSVSLSIGVEF